MLGAFGLLDFTMLRPVLHGVRFETYEPFISLIFQIFISGRDQPRIQNPRIQRSTCIQNPITTHIVLRKFKEVVRITVLDTKRISQNKKNTFCERTKT